MTNLAEQAVWIVITGAIREEAFLLRRLAFFAEMRRFGYAQQVLFSTWKGEIQKSPATEALLRELEIILVESDEPDVVCRGHYLHQMVALEHALDVCPDNTFVFRTRTDKCGDESGILESDIATFLRERKYVHPCDDDLGIFNFKIGVYGNHTSVSLRGPVLFFWNDRTYFGLKQDLKKFISYNLLVFDYQGVIPEQALFSPLFATFWPSISLFFRAVHQSETIDKILRAELPSEKADALTAFLVGNRLFRQAFLTERYVLHKYFFDMPSAAAFDFETRYRSVDVRSDDDMEPLLAPLAERKLHALDLQQEVASLMNYLEAQSAITPVRARVTRSASLPHYVFSTPRSNLTIRTPLGT